MKSILREQWLTSALVALVTCALGTVLLLWPESSISMMCSVLGGSLLLFGLLYVAAWFAGKGKRGASSLLLIPGVVLAGLGVWLMISAESVISLIQYVFAAVLLFHGFVDLQGAFALLRYHAQRWWVDLLLALATFGLGALVLVNPFGTFSALVMLMGVALIYDGLTDLWLILRLSRAHKVYIRSLEAPDPPPAVETEGHVVSDGEPKDIPTGDNPDDFKM